ncbi:UDP-N-acetylmuramoyl-L-alanine--D-glutamate ligase [Pelodictyon luteolum]|uniref:UDP-N-acetylmuramoylalanine--D-glutamate ligase n=1 Tax=Chlorobium luteolum (strain DSM 273 / BCRC 81028 / 2530) TaxID=319225 RepID=MURD_CHLL3|nr:UDP-N-acetylmuramoyl-L-alanine--D-glutamate ligase [Pelodictyon luteolum]Q3B127.1 RecName: Full=UDP-N-acetylmuramoylalanine--D-glutamate ligase; AltName: Full=D-glutamic acid-adding enzyme; AltName: Full=UDP-N-acetylmuramoyl-L-alanyl-D-glutamate synthetase [Pelodictyon luteolum DSM 273]ABB24954.1 UDP-N-acetylmuramoylalanine--D-glutamate ligase [Pelodictyon luteolum DSM 273]
MKRADLAGRKVSVIGAGRSGNAAVELLLCHGARVLLSEKGALDPDTALRFRQRGAEVESEGHSDRVFDADFAVVSPGVPPGVPVIRELERRQIPVHSEIELASWFCRARIAGITGTDGKTTTATLVQRMAEAVGRLGGYRAYGVGNIGVPFSSKVEEMEERDIAVVELSSYQLERCSSFRPEAALITNITPDHLDRYGGDIMRYADAKYRIAMNLGSSGTLVYNADDPILRARFSVGGLQFSTVPFSTAGPVGGDPSSGIYLEDGWVHAGLRRLIHTSEFQKGSFRGNHNNSNVLGAIGLARALRLDEKAVLQALREFPGVEHRQEFVASKRGSDWINDSKATNVNAMRQALEAVPGRIVLIAGGRDKGNDYSAVATLVREKADLVVAMGESRQKVADAFRADVAVVEAATLEDAVRLAAGGAGTGRTVLFSPGCASFDLFRDFEDRGRSFKAEVGRLEA